VIKPPCPAALVIARRADVTMSRITLIATPGPSRKISTFRF
jgi:hypothetical protein